MHKNQVIQKSFEDVQSEIACKNMRHRRQTQIKECSEREMTVLKGSVERKVKK